MLRKSTSQSLFHIHHHYGGNFKQKQQPLLFWNIFIFQNTNVIFHCYFDIFIIIRFEKFSWTFAFKVNDNVNDLQMCIKFKLNVGLMVPPSSILKWSRWHEYSEHHVLCLIFQINPASWFYAFFRKLSANLKATVICTNLWCFICTKFIVHKIYVFNEWCWSQSGRTPTWFIPIYCLDKQSALKNACLIWD